MLKAERQDSILDLLNEETFMTVVDLASIINVSEMTIRRDLKELESEEKLVRLYGGAQKLIFKDKELSTDEKISLHIEKKEHIGKVMNTLISEGDVVYLGAGTTIFYALPFITKKNLLIVTNSLISFNYLIQHTDHKLLLTGGEFSPTTEEFIGPHAESIFETLNIDISFAATNGIYNDNITTSNSLEGQIQQAAFKSSKTKVIVADSTKFNTSDIFTFYKLSNLDYLITDKDIDENTYRHYSEIGKILN